MRDTSISRTRATPAGRKPSLWTPAGDKTIDEILTTDNGARGAAHAAAEGGAVSSSVTGVVKSILDNYPLTTPVTAIKWVSKAAEDSNFNVHGCTSIISHLLDAQ